METHETKQIEWTEREMELSKQFGVEAKTVRLLTRIIEDKLTGLNDAVGNLIREPSETAEEPEAVENDDPYSDEHLADPNYVPTTLSKKGTDFPGAECKKIYKRIRNIFLQANPREKLLLLSFWELNHCQGFTGLDIGNDIMARMDEDFEIGGDPEMIWLKGAFQAAELLNAYS